MGVNVILKTLQRAGDQLADPAQQLEILRDPHRLPGVSFRQQLTQVGVRTLRRQPLGVVQVNVGRVCNQTCTHCHVDAGPDRREQMSAATVEQVLGFLSASAAQTLDITGGAPEMNPHFRTLVTQAVALGKRVIDRCNLTILVAPGFTYLPEFLAAHRVQIVASLPCYLEENCDSQRGDGVFAKSIQAIQTLNRYGYGLPGSEQHLDLVYNPTGWGLPPSQEDLESAYRAHLADHYGIQFNRLYTITNMPISRFLAELVRQQKYQIYMETLIQHFNPRTLDGLMCRDLVSVDWQGYIYDCDFNQMLGLVMQESGDRLHISQLTDVLLAGREIQIDNHCYGCTAGCGSSCSGSLLPGAPALGG
jgi:radical SAM/Cys-rich protein